MGQFLRRRAASLLHYALILGLVGAGSVAALQTVGNEVDETFVEVDDVLEDYARDECSLPWGGTLRHSRTVDGYTRSQAGRAEACGTFAATATCEFGTLSPDLASDSCGCAAGTSLDADGACYGDCAAVSNLSGYAVSALTHGQRESFARSDGSDPSGTYGFEADFACEDGTTRMIGSESQVITNCAPGYRQNSLACDRIECADSSHVNVGVAIAFPVMLSGESRSESGTQSIPGGTRHADATRHCSLSGTTSHDDGAVTVECAPNFHDAAPNCEPVTCGAETVTVDGVTISFSAGLEAGAQETETGSRTIAGGTRSATATRRCTDPSPNDDGNTTGAASIINSSSEASCGVGFGLDGTTCEVVTCGASSHTVDDVTLSFAATLTHNGSDTAGGQLSIDGGVRSASATRSCADTSPGDDANLAGTLSYVDGATSVTCDDGYAEDGIDCTRIVCSASAFEAHGVTIAFPALDSGTDAQQSNSIAISGGTRTVTATRNCTLVGQIEEAVDGTNVACNTGFYEDGLSCSPVTCAASSHSHDGVALSFSGTLIHGDSDTASGTAPITGGTRSASATRTCADPSAADGNSQGTVSYSDEISSASCTGGFYADGSNCGVVTCGTSQTTVDGVTVSFSGTLDHGASDSASGTLTVTGGTRSASASRSCADASAGDDGNAEGSVSYSGQTASVACDQGYYQDGTSCRIVTCGASNHTYDGVTLSFGGSLTHGQTDTASGTLTIPGGTRSANATRTCMDATGAHDNQTGSVSYSSESSLASCSTGFSAVGTSCEPNGCDGGTTDGYDHGAMVHGASQSVAREIPISHGRLPQSATATCATGVVSISSQSDGTAICDGGYSRDTGNNSCVATTRSCIIANGDGTQDWGGTSYGGCTVASCNTNHQQRGNSCLRECGPTTTTHRSTTISFSGIILAGDTQDGTGSGPVTGGTRSATATRSCNTDGTSSFSAQASSATCTTGYTVSGDSCTPNSCGTGSVSGYSFTNLTHGNTQRLTRTQSITNGSRSRDGDVTCSLGVASVSNQSGWVYSCDGGYTPSGSACVEIINGACGSGQNQCSSGTLTDITDSNTQNLWECIGANTGSTASCSFG